MIKLYITSFVLKLPKVPKVMHEVTHQTHDLVKGVATQTMCKAKFPVYFCRRGKGPLK